MQSTYSRILEESIDQYFAIKLSYSFQEINPRSKDYKIRKLEKLYDPIKHPFLPAGLRH